MVNQKWSQIQKNQIQNKNLKCRRANEYVVWIFTLSLLLPCLPCAIPCWPAQYGALAECHDQPKVFFGPRKTK